MIIKNVLGIIVISLILLCFVNACGTGVYTIKDDNFTASDICDGQGVWVLHSEGATAQGDISVTMLKDGFPNIWCHGLTHMWVGEATYAGYTFKSSQDDPLYFVVDRQKGYYYIKGSGTVTEPDGKVVTLP